jgi:manganese oxidase
MLMGVFGIVASMGMGWMVARSTAGLPPFQVPGPSGGPVVQMAAQTLNLVATDLKYDTKELKLAGPGEVHVKLENKGVIEHDVAIEGVRGKVYAAPGRTAEGTFKIDKAGTYTYYCTIPGHREAGMIGKLAVGDGLALSTGAAKGADSHSQATHVSHATTVSTQKQGNQELKPVIDNGVKVFNLTARAVKWEVLPGVFEEAWTYNDQLPGPVIRATEGDRVRVTLKNELPEETVIHFHGPKIPNAMDGVPDVTQPTIKVGQTFSYEFTATPSGTFVYHSHHNSAVQEPLGLYGVLIIDPKPGTALAQRDAQYARDYIQVVSEFAGYFTVNGKAFPATEVIEAKVGEKVRIRLINLGQAPHPMHLHGHHFKVVGTDGMPVMGEPWLKDTINIAPGERYDLEIDADNPGTWVFHCHILSHVANRGVEPGGMITVVKVV